MELRSYDESYLPNAMNLMSSMLECAVDHFHQDADRFFHLFLLSPMCGQFESGDPALLQDHTGLELCCMALGKLDPPSYVPSIEEHTPLSWAARSLTYCQWYMNRTFREIVLCVPLSEILSWYSTLIFPAVSPVRLQWKKRLSMPKMQSELGLKPLSNRGSPLKSLIDTSICCIRSLHLYSATICAFWRMRSSSPS